MFSSLEPVLVTSADLGGESRFSGYAYVGADIILGSTGFDEWVAANPGIEFPQHQDGCYLHARREADGWSVSGDFKGYCKIYFYQAGDRWAFSNSFAELIDRVRSEGWAVTPETVLLKAWQPMPTFWQQLATIQTAVREIRLLPRRATLRAGTGGIRWESPPPEAASPDPDQYSERLSLFLEQWVGRILTVFNSEGGQFQLELTGGRDSRTTLALALVAKQMAGVPLAGRLAVRSSTAHPNDLKCATSITEQYGLDLNVPPVLLGRPVVALAPYERWRQFALGSYAPIVLPPGSRQDGLYTVGGHGGEGHRSFYAFDTLFRPVDSHRDVRTGAERSRLRELMEETVLVLRSEYPGVDPLIAHYKEFRDRLHSGLHSLHQVRMQPLSSYLLEDAMLRSSHEAAMRGQVLFDVMTCCAPGLPFLPFEVPEKAASPEILGNLVGPLPLAPAPGQVFGARQPPPSAPRGAQGWARFVAAFRAAERALRGAVLPDNVWEEARTAVKILEKGGRLGHARDSVRLHQVLLAAHVCG